MDDYIRFAEPELLAAIRSFIVENWEQTVRESPVDIGTLTALPYRYTVPSRKKSFQELYYWDTYFTCLGLLESGRIDLAILNARNLLSQLERFGFVPNGNRTYFLTRSQPPYLGPLLARLAEEPVGGSLLAEALPLLRQEYKFWTLRRNTAVGLSRYGHDANEQELLEFHKGIAVRAGLPKDARTVRAELSHLMAECESGWDFNPRFDGRCGDFCAVDLNCLLYFYEELFAAHSSPRETETWHRLAAERVAKLNQLCWDEERGGFFDFDYVRGHRSPVVSCATFQALWAGLATREQAERMVCEILPQLECSFGIAACAIRPQTRRYQWDFPNGWPCLHHIAAVGLQRYGYVDAARRVARKYLSTVARSFQETGDLWEKYNVEDGSPYAFAEAGYEGGESTNEKSGELKKPPAMMGWTAGTFMTLLPFIDESNQV